MENLDQLHNALKKLKTVTKRIIESGKCLNCKKRKVAHTLPKDTVEIWRDIKKLNCIFSYSFMTKSSRNNRCS